VEPRLIPRVSEHEATPAPLVVVEQIGVPEVLKLTT
jgi:hypothetical protein